jgi:Tol biopolymer transport system component
MTMKGGIGQVLCVCVLLGCTAKGVRYTRLPVDPTWSLVYVKGQDQLCLDPVDSVEPRLVFQAPGSALLLPRASPDGANLAFYRFKDRRGELNLVPLGVSVDDAVAQRKMLVEIEGAVGHRMIVFAPIWESNGRSLLVVAQDGIYRIATDGGHERLVAHSDILGASLSADENRIAYADGEGVFVVDAKGASITSTRTLSRSNPKRQAAHPVAFSPDGTRIAYAAGRYLFIWDWESKEGREIQDMADPIFWIEWLPGGQRLVFMTGSSVRNVRSSPAATPYAVAEGHCDLYSIKVDGHGLTFLFRDREIDVYLAQPTLSPDGRHVALVSVINGEPRVMIAATDAAKETPLVQGAASHASWIPPSSELRPDVPSPGVCRAVVFYAVD